IQGVFTTTNNTISGNVISSTTNGSGISIGGAGNVITGNTVNSNSDRGMYLSGCTGLTVANNTVSSNVVFGIELNGCSNSTVSGNVTASNAQDGIRLFGGSSNNMVTGNTSTNNQGSGVVLWADANNNTITNNAASSNGVFTRYGIYLVGSHNNTIDGNATNSNTGSGIRLWASNDNTIKNNSIGFNGLAGFLFTVVPSTGNTIYHNNISSNGTPQAQDVNPALNYWHHPYLQEGNFWSDYNGVDDGSGAGKHAIAGDGIGDTLIPHPATDFDFYPFVNPNGWEIRAISVAIDSKPGSFPNSINPRSRGRIPVAILTTDTFDATTVDPTTVFFGASGTEAAPVHAALEDVDGDGDIDMILHFNTQNTGIACGNTSASLTGKTLGGQMIEGSDSINTVGCK
ncbi:MAG: right-handed parallel beta-helix repeat-containing protein, partial [Acidobacteria bacterium]|nr:right-handed parallel beta-helix repeat-containing protein [Acidobacteriota bacterium]